MSNINDFRTNYEKYNNEYYDNYNKKDKVAIILSEVEKLKSKVESLPENDERNILLLDIISLEREINAQLSFLRSLSGMR